MLWTVSICCECADRNRNYRRLFSGRKTLCNRYWCDGNHIISESSNTTSECRYTSNAYHWNFSTVFFFLHSIGRSQCRTFFASEQQNENASVHCRNLVWLYNLDDRQPSQSARYCAQIKIRIVSSFLFSTHFVSIFLLFFFDINSNMPWNGMVHFIRFR